MNCIIAAAAISDIGNLRTNNEDNLYFNQTCLPVEHEGTEGLLTDTRILEEQEAMTFAVFDGMGGEAFGEEASYRAAKRFAEEAKRFDGTDMKICFLDICRKMNRDVYEILAEKRCLRTGTTLAAVGITEQEICWCNLGDSRIYGRKGDSLIQLSEDHTNEKLMRELGIMNQKGQLTQYLGMSEEQFELEPSIGRASANEYDQILLCSDGLTDMVDPEQMQRVLEEKAPAAACAELTSLALEHGGKDNITMIVISIKHVKGTNGNSLRGKFSCWIKQLRTCRKTQEQR